MTYQQLEFQSLATKVSDIVYKLFKWSQINIGLPADANYESTPIMLQSIPSTHMKRITNTLRNLGLSKIKTSAFPKMGEATQSGPRRSAIPGPNSTPNCLIDPASEVQVSNVTELFHIFINKFYTTNCGFRSDAFIFHHSIFDRSTDRKH